METVTLEKIKFGVTQVISEQCLNDLSFDIVDYIADMIAIQVRGFVWAEQESAKKRVISYPVDWRQAFKERWFPAWAKKRWPVKWKIHTIDVKAIYPEFKAAVPGQKYVLHIMHNEEIWPVPKEYKEYVKDE